MSGTLYVVATPLGNLDDLSPRAAATLKAAAAVAAEDTRHTKTLLAHVDSHAELVSFHAHSPDSALRRILHLLGAGKDVALVTDAGPPTVSDPGAGRSAPRSRSPRPRLTRGRDDAQRCGRAPRGGNRDHAQPRVSARERTMMVGRSDGRTVGLLLLLALYLPSDGPTVRRSVASLTIGRLHYDGGGDWYSGPSKLVNLLGAIRQRTRLAVSERERVVTLTSPGLWDVPYLYMTGHGNVRFADEEVPILPRYLEQGGFLHADDDYGMDTSFRREIARVFPDHPLVEVPLTHPIYHVPYEFPTGLPKIHEHDGLPAQGFGIFLGDRLVVYYSYQTDLGDGWEDPEVHHDPPELHEAALRMGVNLFTYAVSSTR